MLEPSLADKLVPRWDFLCLLAKQHNASNVEQPATLLLRYTTGSDAKFAKEFSVFDEVHGDMMYDEHFRKARWNRYRQAM